MHQQARGHPGHPEHPQHPQHLEEQPAPLLRSLMGNLCTLCTLTKCTTVWPCRQAGIRWIHSSGGSSCGGNAVAAVLWCQAVGAGASWAGACRSVTGLRSSCRSSSVCQPACDLPAHRRRTSRGKQRYRNPGCGDLMTAAALGILSAQLPGMCP